MKPLVKWLGVLGLVFAGGWSAWWYVGASGWESVIEAWLKQQRDRGWQAEAASVEVTGYPMDFRLEANDIALTDPGTGWAWTSPWLIAASKPHSPTQYDITLPKEQTIAFPEDRADVRSETMDALFDLRPGLSLELREVSARIEALMITGQKGWKAGADAVDLNIAERPEDLGPAHAYDLLLEGDKIRLPKAIVARIDPTGWLQPSVDRLTLKGHAAFDDPLDRFTVEEGRLALRLMTIREAGFQWGDMRLDVRGSFEVDDNGYPVGDIRVEAREWRQMVRLAVSSGMIDRGMAKTVTDAIEFVNALTGSGDALTVPLGLSGGNVKIGPFAIARAPRLAPPR